TSSASAFVERPASPEVTGDFTNVWLSRARPTSTAPTATGANTAPAADPLGPAAPTNERMQTLLRDITNAASSPPRKAHGHAGVTTPLAAASIEAAVRQAVQQALARLDHTSDGDGDDGDNEAI